MVYPLVNVYIANYWTWSSRNSGFAHFHSMVDLSIVFCMFTIMKVRSGRAFPHVPKKMQSLPGCEACYCLFISMVSNNQSWRLLTPWTDCLNVWGTIWCSRLIFIIYLYHYLGDQMRGWHGFCQKLIITKGWSSFEIRCDCEDEKVDMIVKMMMGNLMMGLSTHIYIYNYKVFTIIFIRYHMGFGKWCPEILGNTSISIPWLIIICNPRGDMADLNWLSQLSHAQNSRRQMSAQFQLYIVLHVVS